MISHTKQNERSKETVLITGFPSFNTYRLCQEILSSPYEFQGRIYFLVHPKKLEEAQKIINRFSSEKQSYLYLLEGDTTAIDLGLSAAEFETLTREINRIHHWSEIQDPPHQASIERICIEGTHEILEFARACTRLRCLIYHSSTAVSGDKEGIVFETDLKMGQRFQNIMQQMHARAEKKVRQAMSYLPIAVIRPNWIVGDSIHGEVDMQSGPGLFIQQVISHPFISPPYFQKDALFPVVPIDYVTRAANQIGCHDQAYGHTFHLIDPQPLRAEQAFQLIAELAGYPSTKATGESHFSPVRILQRESLWERTPLLRFFLDSMTIHVRYDSTEADQLLAGSGLHCAPFESYVSRLVHSIQHKNRESQEGNA
ncbi:SDR family oxidoreductase [Pajaroellobacter abortibovis]|uniref:Thioester reductase (TE) domain-containing protein n=1 Tax=Pajaroellobacter abortibovis TaxID=1882918 RepID=A0A1L6MWY2_9BACT|nr:SDR family oxidoreductase [Pajaroellobacter abortibovis]APS00047.1 hypothetical protein BCY86_04650 [Pajaroellobacter abortibovis]